MQDAIIKRKINFVITTEKGIIPHIIDGPVYDLKKPFKIFLDDFLYKESYYEKNKLSIHEFIGIQNEGKRILVSAKYKGSVLVSKKGHYKLSEVDFKNVIDRIKSSNEILINADYKENRLFMDEIEVVEPKDLNDFNRLVDIKEGNLIFGTDFINKISNEACLLYQKDSVLISIHINDSNVNDFKNINNLEYIKYLYSIKEMNSYSFITEYNYIYFNEYITNFNKH